MNCNKEKCKILHLGRNNGLESRLAEKDLRVLVDNKLSMNHDVPLQHRRLTAPWLH